jgi:hypothetical protein
LADNFDLSIYVASWSYEDSNDFQGTRYDSSSIEAVFYLTNPVTDAFGSALYAEFAVGEDALAFEQKLLLQKDWKNWTFAYNLVFETELEGVFQDEGDTSGTSVEGILGNVLGVSYAIGRGDFRVGAETQIESVFDNWSHYEDTTVYAGPVFSYQGAKNWWVTVTPMFQLSSIVDEPDFHLRAIAGLSF